MKYFLTVIGMIMVIEGIPYFIFPHKFKEISIMIQEFTDSQLRVFGLIIMLLGLIVVYLAKL